MLFVVGTNLGSGSIPWSQLSPEVIAAVLNGSMPVVVVAGHQGDPEPAALADRLNAARIEFIDKVSAVVADYSATENLGFQIQAL